MNILILSIAFAAICITMYLVVARLSRKDERGRQLWRKLMTPTPLDAFSPSGKNDERDTSHLDRELSLSQKELNEIPPTIDMGRSHSDKEKVKNRNE